VEDKSYKSEDNSEKNPFIQNKKGKSPFNKLNNANKFKMNKNKIILEASNQMDIESNIIDKNELKQNDINIDISDESTSGPKKNIRKKEKLNNLIENNKNTSFIPNNQNKHSSNSLIQINPIDKNIPHKKELDDKINNFNQKFFDYKNFNNVKSNLTNSNLSTSIIRELKDDEIFNSNSGVKKAKKNWIKKDQNIDNSNITLNFNANNKTNILINNKENSENFIFEKEISDNNNELIKKSIIESQNFLKSGVLNDIKEDLQDKNKFFPKLKSSPLGNPSLFLKNDKKIDKLENPSDLRDNYNDKNSTVNLSKSDLVLNNYLKNNNIIREENFNLSQNSTNNKLEFENDNIQGNLNVFNNFKKLDNTIVDKTSIKDNFNYINDKKIFNDNDIDFDLLENVLEDDINTKKIDKKDTSYELKFHTLENNDDDFYRMKISYDHKNQKALKFRSNITNKNELENINLINSNNMKKKEKNSININLNNSNQDLLSNINYYI